MRREIECCVLLLWLLAAPAGVLRAQTPGAPPEAPPVPEIAVDPADADGPGAGDAAAPAALPAGGAAPATADTPPVAPGPLTATPAESRLTERLLWTAGALQSVLANQDYASVLLLSAVNRAMAGAPDGPAVTAALSLARSLSDAGALRRMQACRAAADPLENVLCSVESLVAAAPAELSRWIADEGARLVGDAFRAGAPSGVPERFGSVGLLPGGAGPAATSLQRLAEPVLEEVWRLAATGDGAPALRDVVARLVGLDPAGGLDALLRDARIAQLVETHPVVARLTEGEAALRDLVDHYRSVVDSSARTVGALLDAATASGDGDPFRGLTAALDRRLDWAADRSLAYLASRAAELMGEDAGTVGRIRAIGSAVADLEHGISTFVRQLSTAGPRLAAQSLGGNILSVAMGITSFFGLTPGAFGPEAARDVRALRAAVDTLRAELHGRLDVVDATLDSLLLAVDSGFGRLERAVASGNAQTRAELQALGEELGALARRLDRMETNLLSYLQDGFSREYNRTLVRCLEHRERHLPPYDEMAFAVFSDCLAEFRTRAVRDARDALLTDQTTPVDDASLERAFAGSDGSLDTLGRQLPLLGRVAELRFGYRGMGGGRSVANPVEWAVAAQAYLTLLHDWPDHVAAVTSGDLEAILQVGRELAATLDAITHDPAGGERGAPIRAALDQYRARAAELRAEADVLARRHQQSGLLRGSPDSLLTRIHPANGAGVPGTVARTALLTPNAIAVRIPEVVRTAALLGLGEATLTYRVELEDSTHRDHFRHAFLFFGKRHDRLTYTRARVHVELRYGGNGVLARFTALGPYVLRRTEEMAGDATSEDVRATREHVPDMYAHFLQVEWPRIAADPLAWQYTAPDPWVLATIGGRIEAELRRYATAALDNVFASVCGLPSARPLGADDAASAERMRAALGAMTAARGLIEGYVRLGLPFSAETDPALRATLFGPEAILDRQTLCDAVSNGESALRLVWIGDNVSRRAEALATTLDDILARQTGPERLPLVEDTLRQLEAAIRLQRLRAAVARANG